MTMMAKAMIKSTHCPSTRMSNRMTKKIAERALRREPEKLGSTGSRGHRRSMGMSRSASSSATKAASSSSEARAIVIGSVRTRTAFARVAARMASSHSWLDIAASRTLRTVHASSVFQARSRRDSNALHEIVPGHASRIAP